MYLAERRAIAPAAEGSPPEPSTGATGGIRRRAPLALLALGLTSFFTDISSEMVAAALPLYLAGELGFTVAQVGVFDGFQKAASIAVRLLGGRLVDRSRRPKAVAVVGYGLSMLTRWVLVVSATIWPILLATGADRLGKGLRTPARDTLISRNTGTLGTASAFGVHRALDTAGALLGPLLVFAFLAVAPRQFATLWLLSALAAMAGLVWLVTFVPSDRPAQAPAMPDTEAERTEAERTQPVPADAATASPPLRALWTDRRSRRLLTLATVLGLGTVGDPVLFIALETTGAVSLASLPLLFAGSALVFVVLAVPIGRLADRVGAWRMYVLGHLPLLVIYAALAVARPAGGAAFAALVVGALGLYYAATDGVGVAAVVARIDDGLRGRAIAVFSSAVLLGRLIASAIFGLLWSAGGALPATAVAAGSVLIGLYAARRWSGQELNVWPRM